MNFPGQTQTTGSNAPDADAEVIEVDLNAEVEAEHPDADFNLRLPPMPAGAHLFKWEFQDKGEKGAVQPSATKKPPHTPFLNIYLAGKLQEDGSVDNGANVNYYLNSLVNRKSGTSEAHHFLSVIGSPAPQKITLGNLKALIEGAVEAGPISPALVEWRCSYKDPNTGNWVEQYSRQDQFPWVLDDNGKSTGVRSNVAISKLDGAELFAQAYIVKLLTDSDYKKMIA